MLVPEPTFVGGKLMLIFYKTVGQKCWWSKMLIFDKTNQKVLKVFVDFLV